MQYRIFVIIIIIIIIVTIIIIFIIIVTIIITTIVVVVVVYFISNIVFLNKVSPTERTDFLFPIAAFRAIQSRFR